MKDRLTRGIHHFALKAQGDTAYDKAVTFYRDALGMPVIREWADNTMRGIMLDSGGGIVELMSNGTDSPSQGVLRHLAFVADDVDACIHAVREAGYPVTVEPADLTIASTPPFPVRIAFCIGPLGEEIEFFHEY